MLRDSSNKYVLSAAILLCIAICIIIIIFGYLAHDWRKNYQSGIDKFEMTFLLDLPPKTTILSETSDRDLQGDGIYFYIFEVDKEEVNLLVEQSGFEHWSKLPISYYHAERIENSINHSSLGQSFCTLMKSIREGYYYYQEIPINTLPDNILLVFNIAIFDVENCYIYYLDVDMY